MLGVPGSITGRVVTFGGSVGTLSCTAVATSVERLGTNLHKKGKCVVNWDWEGTLSLRCPVSPV